MSPMNEWTHITPTTYYLFKLDKVTMKNDASYHEMDLIKTYTYICEKDGAGPS